MSGDGITVRECVSFGDFQKCVELERRVWRDEDIDIMPVRLYKMSKASKAPTFGAFNETDSLVGFGHTMIALLDGNVAYHSHMLAVEEDLRDQDIGRRIKLAQRTHAIDAGVQLIFWTFDPLQSRNAHLNINKLGAVIRRYEENYYGMGVSTGFDAEVPTDRVIAEWWVSSSHVEAALADQRPRVESPVATVEIPDDINAIRARTVAEHMEWRLRVRGAFQSALHPGAIVRGFIRDEANRTSRYLLGPDEDQFHFRARNIEQAG
jgi:predicted GNAT superfamily acetyltransferase